MSAQVIIEFEVEGHAVQKGSKIGHVPTYGDGVAVRRHVDPCPASGPDSDKALQHHFAAQPCRCPIMVNMVDDAGTKKLEAWVEAVQWKAKAAMRSREPLAGLVEVGIVFFRKRPKNHYGTGRNERLLKDTAPAAPGVTPDWDKLARSVGDALIGYCYTDDSVVVDALVRKRYVNNWEEERTIIRVSLLPVQTVGDMVEAGVIDLPHLRPVDQLDLFSLTAAA